MTLNYATEKLINKGRIYLLNIPKPKIHLDVIPKWNMFVTKMKYHFKII